MPSSSRELLPSIDWLPAARDPIGQGEYVAAAAMYQAAIEAQPDTIVYYWHLGLLQFLTGDEVAAQLTWMVPLMNGSEQEIQQRTRSLTLLLDEAAGDQHSQENYQLAWALRQHIHQLDPESMGNLLLLVQLAAQLDILSAADWASYGLGQRLKNLTSEPSLLPLLRTTIAALLENPETIPYGIEVIEASLPHFEAAPQSLLEELINQANRIGHKEGNPRRAAQVLALGRQLAPNHLLLLRFLSLFYQNSGAHPQAIQTAQQCYDNSTDLAGQVAANHVLLRGLMTVCSQWRDIEAAFQRHLTLLERLADQANQGSLPAIPPAENRWLFTAPFFQPYLRDDLAGNRRIQNQTAAIAQAQARSQHRPYSYTPKATPSRLKVGYVSACLRRHSVGWLARWLYRHHDRDQVEIYSYLINSPPQPDWLQSWYIEQSNVVRKLDAHSPHIAEQIYADQVDILVDLDSITLDTTCEVMALKPAPVQVSWLGWDASGIPAVDYYIADPYVLPRGAEAHYSETLWRLPQTYIAVEGFETNAPSLRRSDLDIPDDAVVYLSAQRAYKRHPYTIRLQLEIIRAVPGSYFVLKAMTIDSSLKAAFIQLAEEVGVSPDRLRFLTGVPEEATHRANLAIADVVLDTYPYNGATTTLEVLWAGIPLVTRVGETFSSRNSYTMMHNAGISEGIAWSDEEYVDWGIRFGKEADLRRQVAWKLRGGRRTAPLWDARQFARDMEQAYWQMWHRAS